MTKAELAQAIADYFYPPIATEVAHRQPDGSYGYTQEVLRHTPNHSTTTTIIAQDGYPSTRCLTYLEIAEAILEKYEVSPKDV